MKSIFMIFIMTFAFNNIASACSNADAYRAVISHPFTQGSINQEEVTSMRMMNYLGFSIVSVATISGATGIFIVGPTCKVLDNSYGADMAKKSPYSGKLLLEDFYGIVLPKDRTEALKLINQK